MSHTYTSKPSVVRTGRGATRGAGTRGADSQRNRATTMASESPPSEESPTRRPDIDERTQRRDAYTVIVPDEDKRHNIQQKAKEEERRYKEHKEKSRLTHVSYVGTVGGAEGGTAVVPPNKQPKPAGLTPQQKTRQYRAVTKAQEDAEIAKKKAEQRRQSDLNVEREQQRRDKLNADRQRCNDAFLSRLEQKSQKSVIHRQAVVAHEAAAAEGVVSQSAERTGDTMSTSDVTASLTQLQQAFPQYDVGVLRDILDQAGGDVALAMEVLS